MQFKVKKLSVFVLIISITLSLFFREELFPRKLISSSYKNYSITIHQYRDNLKLKYFFFENLSEERVLKLDEKISKDDIKIDWSEDTVQDEEGGIYPRISLNVYVMTNSQEILPFFEWQMYDWSEQD